MGFKTITIKEEVYRELLNAKGESESFSEFFDRLVKEKKKAPDLKKLYGAWNTMSKEEFSKITKAVKELRKSADRNFEERMKRFYK